MGLKDKFCQVFRAENNLFKNYNSKLKAADVYYKISDQQELIWSYDGTKPDAVLPAKVAPIAFYKASNYETNFYALSDTAAVNKMTSNIDYPGEAWPCEIPDTATKGDWAFSKSRSYTRGFYPQDSNQYEFQDGNLNCNGDYTIKILAAEFGRPFEKPICQLKENYDVPDHMLYHGRSNFFPTCSSGDLFSTVSEKCNGKRSCRISPNHQSKYGETAKVKKCQNCESNGSKIISLSV